MAARITTFRDLVEHVVDMAGGVTYDQHSTQIKRAVNEAVRDLFNIHQWRYAIRQHSVPLNAGQSSSTITYTHSTRALDIAAGSWPTMTDAANWSVLIAGNVYRVQARTSSTSLTLHPVLNPGANIAAGTSYELFQNAYDLPDDFGGMHGFYMNGAMASCYLEPHEFEYFEANGGTSASPFYWTVMASLRTPGKWALRLLGYPSTAKPIFFLYRQQATDLKWVGFETAVTAGTVSVTSGSATITGSSTAFTTAMEGRIIRLGDASGSNIPTNNDGQYPYAEELRIKTVNSTTSATAYTNASQSLATCKYCISDLIDIVPPMINALIAGAVWKLQTKDAKERDAKHQMYQQEVRRAMESDRHQLDRGVWGSDISGWVYRDMILNPPS